MEEERCSGSSNPINMKKINKQLPFKKNPWKTKYKVELIYYMRDSGGQPYKPTVF